MISAIVAIADNGVIGRDGEMPWPRVSEDMKWFVEKTTGHLIIMGRKTWDSIPSDKKPLKNRINIVVTSQPLAVVPGARGTLTGELTEGLKAHQRANADKEVFVIGGKEIYEQCFPACDKIYITRIHGDYKGDVSLDMDKVLEDFILTESLKNTEICTFETWERKKMILEDNPFGGSILNDLVERKLPLEIFTFEANGRGVHVVQEDEVVTMEIRDDNSRYFPEIENGVVIGGRFR